MHKTLLSEKDSQADSYRGDSMRLLIVLVLGLMYSGQAMSQGEAERAYRIYERLACEPPSKEDLNKMVTLLKEGKTEEAAKMGVETRGFYECTIKNWCLVQTNEAETANAPLNDYCATVIGSVRDQIPFNELLYRDIIYVSDDASLPAYSLKNNDHYEKLQEKNTELTKTLVRKPQTQVTGFSESSGLITTRAFAAGFIAAGTNRRALRHTLRNYICHDIEGLMDTTLSDHFVGKDVDRSPGGDPNDYQNNCKGCHTGMDSLRGAWAYYDFDEETHEYIYKKGIVAKKYNVNADAYPDGFETTDDSWKNMWMEGVNAKFGWPKDLTQGKGIQSFGRMISKVDYLPTCMATRVFRSVCMADEESKISQEIIAKMATEFKNDKYDLKKLFVKTVSACTGE